MGNIFKKVMIGAIIIGVIAVAINTLFGNETIDFITKYRDTNSGIIYYKYNGLAYLNNIEMSLGNTAVLELKLVTKEWQDITGTIVEEQFWAALGNNLAVMLDYIILGLNVLLYPIRIAGYFMLQLLAIIGLNVVKPNENGSLYWLIKLAEGLAKTQIPYV